ncbi:mannosyl-oligosaccharide alpha-1,2-mannosidase-like protein [Dendryphion nanum]|uniref:alpha-1,2-Mannosidase n=1 Tax=Dendryphion nanum TaxID=256645 RepID=A0A9P9DM12_9PLEO|nr:mannosyl-oligosaccharide alpha-1,2-mannosidase-like protein [Dendryphion nanum]
MTGFRRWGKSKFQKNPQSSFKLLAAVLVITLYLVIKEFSDPTVRPRLIPRSFGARIQHNDWRNGTGKADTEKAAKVRDAMKYTFWKYRQNAWGFDDIKPVSGGNESSRNGWGAFIVDSSTTLAVMGLWEELALSVQHIVSIDFTKSEDLVDPFETTIRYLGGLVSLVELSEAGLIPDNIVTPETREKILQQAVILANTLGPAYHSPTGMPWPRLNLSIPEGVQEQPTTPLKKKDEPRLRRPETGPARAGSSILENRVLTHLTGDQIYTQNATVAWSPFVWSKWVSPWPGMVDGPMDIFTGKPTGRQRHWDAGHDSYYEYLLKITILAPQSDPYLDVYKKRFLDAAYSLRKYLATRSSPAPNHPMQHLFIGTQNAHWYRNRQSHLACFAPGTILLGSKYYDQKDLRTFALALLEGCRHVYDSTPSKIGPEAWSWTPKFGHDDPVYFPQGDRQHNEWREMGFWSTEASYRGRPEYVESLFYAWRITGEARFRLWAWEAFSAFEKHSKAPFGYAQITDVFRVQPLEWNGSGEERWIDVQESFWAAETLKYLYLTFTDADVASLDRWVFSTEGHMFRMIRSQ